ncbi:hypothetical protein D3C86_1894330 [compost metagenome]
MTDAIKPPSAVVALTVAVPADSADRFALSASVESMRTMDGSLDSHINSEFVT